MKMNVEYVKGILGELDKYFKNNKRNLIILDDCMDEASQSFKITQLLVVMATFAWSISRKILSTKIYVLLTVSFYHVIYALQSESTHYSCLNVKELLPQKRRHIWGLNDCKGTRTYSHLVCKRTRNHLAKMAKWLSCVSWHIQATIERGFTYKRVRDMIRTNSQMHHTDKYSQHSSTIWSVWLNIWVFIYKLNGCGFESRCSHLSLRYDACFEQGISWHSGNYRVWIHVQTRTWHDKNMQSNAPYR